MGLASVEQPQQQRSLLNPHEPFDAILENRGLSMPEPLQVQVSSFKNHPKSGNSKKKSHNLFSPRNGPKTKTTSFTPEPFPKKPGGSERLPPLHPKPARNGPCLSMTEPQLCLVKFAGKSIRDKEHLSGKQRVFGVWRTRLKRPLRFHWKGCDIHDPGNLKERPTHM